MDSSVRRSTRAKKVPASYSPPPREKPTSSGKGKKKSKPNLEGRKSGENEYSYDTTPDGQPFTCDMCGSHYVIDPYRRNKSGITKRLLPRQRLDPATGQHLMLCNACGIAKMRQVKANHRPKIRSVVTEEEKEQYLKEAKAFADSLVSSLGDTAAEKLFCPRFTSKPCRCIQTYLASGDDIGSGCRQRATYLVRLIHLAQKYSSLKCYDINEIIGPNGRKGKVGIGRGHKKSKIYEDFVMKHRAQLKNHFNLCEVAIKKILCYSNNFLFKKLKSQQSECRVEKVKGRGKKSANFIPIEKLAQEKCCHGKCTVMALSHMTLLQEWRDRAGKGQTEARRVIAEMLTPSGLHTNCYAFIRMVTGVASSVISSVNAYMRETGGCRDPPPHGLKSFWENHPKRRKLDGKSDGLPSSQDNIMEALSVSDSQRLLGADDQRKPVVMTTSKHDLANRQDNEAMLSEDDVSSKPIQLSDVSQNLDQVTVGQNSATSVMVLESGAVLSNTEDHLELITICNPDGSTQCLQVPVIACSNLEGDSLLQDLNLQISGDPGGLILDNSSTILENNSFILDIPTLPHTGVQNSSSVRSQMNPDSQTVITTRATLAETSHCREGLPSNITLPSDQELAMTQASIDVLKKVEAGVKNITPHLVQQYTEGHVKDVSQTLVQRPIVRELPEVKQFEFSTSVESDESNTAVVRVSDGQYSTVFSTAKESSVISQMTTLRNPYSLGTGTQFPADSFCKIQTLPSSDLHGPIVDNDLVLQSEMLYIDSNKILQAPLKSTQGTGSVLYPPNAEVLSTRDFGSLPVSLTCSGSHLDACQYLISSVSSSNETTVKVKAPSVNYVTLQQDQDVIPMQTNAMDNLSFQTMITVNQKEPKACLPPSCMSFQASNQAMTSPSGKVERKDNCHVLGTTSAVAPVQEGLQPVTVVMDQSNVISSLAQPVHGQSQAEGAMLTPIRTSVSGSVSIPVDITCATAGSSVRMTTAATSSLVANTAILPAKASVTSATSTAVIANKAKERADPSKAPTTAIRPKPSTASCLPKVASTQMSIYPKLAPSSTPSSQPSANVSLPVTILAMSTASSSQVVLSTGLMASTLPGLVLSSVVNPVPQVMMPVVENKNAPKASSGQLTDLIQTNAMKAAAAAAAAAPIQGLQLASGSTIILHNTSSQKGGSFSLQHLANHRSGSIAVEHGQGNMYITRSPSSDVQLVQPVVPRLLVPQVEPLKPDDDQQLAGNAVTVPVKRALPPAVVAPDKCLLQTVATILQSTTTSSKQHLREMLPVLPTATTDKHKS